MSEAEACLEKLDTAAAEGRLSGNSFDNIRRWLTQSCYAEYHDRIRALIEANDFETLNRLFWETIAFGTGGRRGRMAEFGSATINARTIAESAHGLASWFRSQRNDGGGRAVVAHDTRNRSAEFARITATTLAAHGLTVFFFESHRATPLLSFAVRHLKCDVGVMISASHNPPADNGFKAYWNTGGQVLPPHDAGITRCVLQAGDIPETDFDSAVRERRIQIVGDAIDEEYVQAVTRLQLGNDRAIRVIYTPLHGVGETSVFRVLQAAGFGDVAIFEPHRSPDGDFPNVPDRLPNPERSQVFDPVLDHVSDIQSEPDLILASDPDADRIAVCARDANGQFIHLDGNRVGALLADYILRKRSAAATLTRNHYVVETLVTTPLMAAIARSHGVRAITDLLVGFKYIARVIDDEGPNEFVFGTEESLGYLAGQYCRDKDAAIAALYVLELAAELRRDGKTLIDRLDELHVIHGYYTERQQSRVCHGPAGREQIDTLMAAFRAEPPATLAGITLASVRDYGRHEIRSLPENAHLTGLSEPRGDLLIMDSIEGPATLSVAARPSGTEPKIKFYFFARADCDSAAGLPDVRTATDGLLGQVQDDLTAWIDSVLAPT